MSQNKKNSDYDIPTVGVFPLQPVLVDGWALDKIPILWGPNQRNCNYNEYNPPASIASWRLFEQLNIPRVVRFIYNKDELGDDSDQDSDPGDQLYEWKITNYCYGAHDSTVMLCVTWTLQEAPFGFCQCFIGQLDTPANFAAMQMQYPFGLIRESYSYTFPCFDVMD
jgi:hypothetical protein